MSKTYKRIPYGYFRNPKGQKNCLLERIVNEEEAPPVRYRAIPPNSWDDIGFDRQVWIPHRACEGMLNQGLSDEVIIKKLMRKFHITSSQARKILKWKRR